MVTLRDVAKKANVSVATVSNVINGNYEEVGKDTRERVMRIATDMKYKPNRIAKSLRTNNSRTIGVIIEDITVFNTPEIIDGICEYAENQGYNILFDNLRLYHRLGNRYSQISECKKSISKIIDTMMHLESEGVIYVGAHYRDVTNIIENSDRPIVYTYCYANDGSSHWVNFDDEEAACQVTEYLIGKGHKKIAIITGMVESIPCQTRLSGYQRAILDNRLLIQPDYVKIGDWTYESGFEQGKQLLTTPNPPTAIFAMNDLMAGGVISAARELGISIPKDLSLIGFDNRTCSFYYTPSLTTVDIPLHQMGRQAAKLLIEQLQGKEDTIESIRLKCEIVERSSVSDISAVD